MILLPKYSCFFPNNLAREKARQRVLNYPPESFESYNDWFFFIHIDPVQRFIHAFGMYVGLYFFFMIVIDWGPRSFYYYLVGVFFFYGLGVVSHAIFDKGTAKSHPKFFLSTLPIVIKFNLLTTFGQYDNELRKFIKKYPFVADAYELEEVPRNKAIQHLLNSK